MNKFVAAIVAVFAIFGAQAHAEIVQLTYTAPAEVQRGEPALVLGAVTDGREHAADWLGAIRGGYGNALKTLRVEGTVSGVVETALRAGLETRGLTAAETARFRLDVRVTQFDCNQYARKEAHIILDLTLVDTAGGASVYTTTVRADRVEGSVFSLRTGIFASVEDLRLVANATMQEGVDRALDDPGLRAALTAALAAVEVPAETTPAAAIEPAAPTEAPPAPAPAN